MKKKGAGAIILGIVLVIVAMAAGIGIGYMIGKSSSDKQTPETVPAETNPITAPIETEPQTEPQTETEPETLPPAEPDDSIAVLKVNDQIVSMNEINVRLYTLRSYYVESYGEEPWGEIIEGKTISEIAKAQLEDDAIRAELCMQKAADYGIVVTDEISAMCLDDARVFIDGLGEEIAGVFGLTLTAVQNVYVKYEVITQVTNALGDQIREELLADEANADLSEGELDVKISEESQKIMETWKSEAKIEYEDVWEQIVVGSLG